MDEKNKAPGLSPRGTEREANKKTQRLLNYTFNESFCQSLPDELKILNQWVCWKLVPNSKTGKPDKLLVCPHTLKNASSTNSKTWGSIDQATKALEKNKNLSGIGFVFVKENNLVAIDLDDCLNEPWAVSLVERSCSYAEITPSGQGYHILVKGRKPGKKCNVRPVEMYDTARFFTVTGNCINGRQITENQGIIDEIYYSYLDTKKPLVKDTKPIASLNEQEIIEKIRKSKNGIKFDLLYGGNSSSYLSESEADLAICSIIAFYTQDHDLIDKIFRSSGLIRDKWDKKINDSTYGARTMEKAIRGLTNTYQEPKAPIIEPMREPGDEDELKNECGHILRQKTADSFNTSELPEMIREYINEIGNETNSDPIIITTSVYSMISAILGKKIYLSNYFQKLYPNIWMLTASGSGNFKTTGLNKGARIVYEKDHDLQIDIEIEKKRLPGLKGKEKADVEHKIKTIEAKSPLLPNRATAEGLLDSLKNNQSGGMFLSEFGDWLKTMEQSYNVGLKALFTDLFDVPEQRTTKTRTGGSVTVKRPFITICGVSTLEWIKSNVKISDVGSGFFARFLIFYPPQKEEIPPALPPYFQKDETKKNKIKQVLNQVEPKAFNLDKEAVVYFNKIHRSLYESTIAHGEATKKLLAPYLKRWSPYILKLGLLNQIFIDPKSQTLTVEALKAALSVVNYAIQSTTYLFENDLGESEHQAKCRKILEYIATKKGNVKRKTILVSKQLPGGVKEYEYVLETLLETGKIIVDTKHDNKNEWKYIINTRG